MRCGTTLIRVDDAYAHRLKDVARDRRMSLVGLTREMSGSGIARVLP